MLWGSSLKPLKKVGLMVLFSGGIFVVVCATLRCVLIVLVKPSVLSICYRYEKLTVQRFRTQRMVHSWLDLGLFEKPLLPSLQPTCP